MYGTLKVEADARGVATPRLARSDRRNAMSAGMLEEPVAAAQALADDSAIRVVVPAGEGRTSCAGGDLAWKRAQAGMDLAIDAFFDKRKPRWAG